MVIAFSLLIHLNSPIHIHMALEIIVENHSLQDAVTNLDAQQKLKYLTLKQ